MTLLVGNANMLNVVPVIFVLQKGDRMKKPPAAPEYNLDTHEWFYNGKWYKDKPMEEVAWQDYLESCAIDKIEGE